MLKATNQVGLVIVEVMIVTDEFEITVGGITALLAK